MVDEGEQIIAAGLLVDSCDSRSMAEAFRKLLVDAAYAAMTRGRAREAVRDEFSQRVRYDRPTEIFQQVRGAAVSGKGTRRFAAK